MSKEITSEQIQTALGRVITKQQEEIDHLQTIVSSRQKQDVRNIEKETELFEMLDKVLDFKLRPHWKDDAEDAFKKYGGILHELRMHMITSGWCLRCCMWGFDCECNE